MAAKSERGALDAKILRMAHDGATLNEIRRATGKHANVIYGRLNRLGGPTLETKGGRLEKEIKTLANQGLNVKQISEKVGRSEPTVRRVVRGAQVKVARVHYKPPAKFDHELAIAFHKNGATGSDIARHFGISRQRVSQILTRAGMSGRIGRPPSKTSEATITLAGSAI